MKTANLLRRRQLQHSRWRRPALLQLLRMRAQRRLRLLLLRLELSPSLPLSLRPRLHLILLRPLPPFRLPLQSIPLHLTILFRRMRPCLSLSLRSPMPLLLPLIPLPPVPPPPPPPLMTRRASRWKRAWTSSL